VINGAITGGLLFLSWVRHFSLPIFFLNNWPNNWIDNDESKERLESLRWWWEVKEGADCSLGTTNPFTPKNKSRSMSGDQTGIRPPPPYSTPADHADMERKRAILNFFHNHF
jgi:hypothetical protein